MNETQLLTPFIITRTNVSKSSVLNVLSSPEEEQEEEKELKKQQQQQLPIFRHVPSRHDEKIVYLRNYNTLNGIIFK